MKLSVEGMARRWLARGPEALSVAEQQALQSAVERRPVSAKRHKHEDALGPRVADAIARVGGSWSFIISFIVFLAVWTLGNAILLGRSEFDPYPFVFLNLILSMLAALQAPVIMMSQNRQAERDRIAAEHDYAVNLKAEIEIMALHEKLDELRQREIVALDQTINQIITRIDSLEKRLQGSNPSGA